MAEYKPQNPEEHFALQRTNRAAEIVKTVYDLQQKASEETRSANERFYNSLALFSSGTVALSVTFLGYLKTLPKPITHPHWLMACWICLIVCLGTSLFWLFTYGHYTHYFHEWQAVQEMVDQGLTKSTVQRLTFQYGRAIAEGGSKLANTQLMPRYQLMMKIIELWPK